MKEKIIEMLNEQIEEYRMGNHALHYIAGIEKAIWIIANRIGDTK